MVKMTHDWLSRIEAYSPRVKSLALQTSIVNGTLGPDGLNFASNDVHVQLVARSAENLLATHAATEKQVKILLGELVHRTKTGGAFGELAAYEWFLRRAYPLKIQVPLGPVDLLGVNGSELDGVLNFPSGPVYFDIKSFGFADRLAEMLRQKLEDLLPGEQVTLEESWDIPIEDFERLLADFTNIAQTLASAKIYRCGRLAIVAKPKARFSVSQRVLDIDLLVDENSRYPFKYANKFTRKTPFILVFVIHPWLGSKELNINFCSFGGRLTSRIANLAFNRFVGDATPVSSFCDKADATPLNDAARLLSGILFLNVWPDGMQDKPPREKRSWLYINTHASNPLMLAEFETRSALFPTHPLEIVKL
jgi:hypothetical protein